MKFTGNHRGVQIVILALIVATVWFSCRARADEPSLFFAAAGIATHGGQPYSQGLRFGLESGSWQASLVTMGEGHYSKPEGRYLLEPNLGACGTWHRGLKRWSIGWGACLWEHGDYSIGDEEPWVWQDGFLLIDDGVQLTAAIVVRRTFGKEQHVYAELFHASTGGSTAYNAGRNLIGGGVRF